MAACYDFPEGVEVMDGVGHGQAGAAQDVDGRPAGFRPELVDEAGDEQGDAHRRVFEGWMNVFIVAGARRGGNHHFV